MTERCYTCTFCDWCTFPVSPEEAAELRWPTWTDEMGDDLARTTATMHVALHHPAQFAAATGKNLEAALAEYHDVLGDYWLEVARRMALLMPSEWER